MLDSLLVAALGKFYWVYLLLFYWLILFYVSNLLEYILLKSWDDMLSASLEFMWGVSWIFFSEN